MGYWNVWVPAKGDHKGFAIGVLVALASNAVLLVASVPWLWSLNPKPPKP